MPHRTRVTALFPENSEAFIAYATNVATCHEGNANFPSPPVSVADLRALIALLVAADGEAGHAAVPHREAARAKVETALRKLETNVQAVLDTAAPADAPHILATSGFPQHKDNSHTKPDYAVTKGHADGSAHLEVKSLGRHGTVQYCHSYSLDGGKTWIDVPTAVDTSVIVLGLPLGVTGQFKFRTLIKGVYGNWSQTLEFLVH